MDSSALPQAVSALGFIGKFRDLFTREAGIVEYRKSGGAVCLIRKVQETVPGWNGLGGGMCHLS